MSAPLSRHAQKRLLDMLAQGPDTEPAPSEPAVLLDGPLGERAVRRGLIGRTQLEEAIREHHELREKGEVLRLGQILLRRGWLTVDQLMDLAQTSTHASGKAGSPSEPSISDSRVGKYRLSRKIAQGGMGVVYLAEDPDLRRTVALKLLKEGETTPMTVKRLHREASLAARLKHHGIVAIHEVGAVRDSRGEMQNFICMDYLPGGTLAEAMEAQRLPLPRLLEVIEEVARALHHAHGESVIHRDIKPGNILFDGADRPVLTDFGLALSEDEQMTRLTRTGAILGTPRYMAPEQVAGKRAEVDARTDVYALGVILYEAVTGRPPFEGDTAVDLYRKILRDEPIRPSQHQPKLSADLETIILKAMAKAREDRYPDALALADDLHRHRMGEPVSARRIPHHRRILRKLRTRKPLAILSLLTLCGLTWGGWMFFRTAQRDKALERLTQAQVRLRSLTEDGSNVQDFRSEVLSIRKELTDLSRIIPEEPDVWINRARASNLLGNETQVHADLQKALQLSPDDGLIHYELARYYRSAQMCLPYRYSGLSMKERELLHRIAGEYRKAFQEHLSKAQNFRNAGVESIIAGLERRLLEDPEEVILQATEKIDEQGDMTPWLVLRASALFQVSRVADATEDLQRALDRSPHDPYIRLSQITFLANKGLRRIEGENGALAEIDRLLQRQPDWDINPALLVWKARSLSLRGRFAEARDEIDRALQAKPDRAPFYVDKGVFLLQQKRWDESEAAFLRALDLDPSLMEARRRLGQIEYLRGHPDAALRHYEEELPHLPETHRNALRYDYALARWSAGHRVPALEDLQEAIRSDSGINPAYFFTQGLFLADESRFDEAIRSYETALRLHHPDQELLSEILWFSLQVYDPQPEDESLPLAERQNRMWARIYFARAVALLKLERRSEARRDLEKVRELDSTRNDEVEKLLAELPEPR